MSADEAMGALARALCRAQAAFPPLRRDRTVTVTLKTGGAYTFSYAPLDSVLAAVRGPLAENGLAVVQLLDEDSLVTRLIHESGASLQGRIDLPQTAGIQEMGSAVTYLRRYALQALLGIAAEDDDDGNRAAGNTARQAPRQPREERREPARDQSADGGLIGTVALGNAWLEDLEVRQTPDGPVLGFRLQAGRQRQKVEAVGPMAVALGGLGPGLVGQTVTCWGELLPRSFTPRGGDRPVEYQVMRLSRIHGASFDIPAPGSGPAAEALAESAGLCGIRGIGGGDVEACVLGEGHAFPDGRPSPHQSESGSRWPNSSTEGRQ